MLTADEGTCRVGGMTSLVRPARPARAYGRGAGRRFDDSYCAGPVIFSPSRARAAPAPPRPRRIDRGKCLLNLVVVVIVVRIRVALLHEIYAVALIREGPWIVKVRPAMVLALVDR